MTQGASGPLSPESFPGPGAYSRALPGCHFHRGGEILASAIGEKRHKPHAILKALFEEAEKVDVPRLPSTALTRSRPWRPPSMRGPARPSNGKRPQRRLTSCCSQPTHSPLRGPLESAQIAFVAGAGAGFYQPRLYLERFIPLQSVLFNPIRWS